MARKTKDDWTRPFVMLDEGMTRDMLFGEIENSLAKLVLLTLYVQGSGGARDVLVDLNCDDLAFATCIEREELPGLLDTLHDGGQIYRGERHLVLMEWRTYRGGGNSLKGKDGLRFVTKGHVRDLLKRENELPKDVRAALAEACDCANWKALKGILDKDDPRGGDHTSAEFKAKKKAQEQNESKTKPKRKRNKSKDTDTDTDTDKDVDKDQDGDEDVAHHHRVDIPDADDDDSGKGPGRKRRRRRQSVPKDDHPKLTEMIANKYAVAFKGRKKYGVKPGTTAYARFKATGDRLLDYYERTTTFSQEDLVDKVMSCAEANLKNGAYPDGRIRPGNLCNDTFWQEDFPDYIGNLLGKRPGRSRRRKET